MIHKGLLLLGNILISTIVIVVIIESGLRLVSPIENQFYIWQPNLQKVFHPLPEYIPGVNGDSFLSINSIGLRGDEYKNEKKGIVTIGDSTTECLYLDQTETWPELLEDMLRKHNESIWIGNAGRSGHGTFQHVLQIRHLLKQHPEIDTVIFLGGGNDFLRRLWKDDIFDPVFEDIKSTGQNLETAFNVIPRIYDKRLPLFKRTATWYFLTKMKYVLAPGNMQQDTAGEKYKIWREKRQNAVAIRNKLPDISDGLQEYKHLLNLMTDEAQKHNVKLVFVTQPSLWKSNVSNYEKSLLWRGNIGYLTEESHLEYYSVSALAEGMKKYNEVMMEVCIKRGTTCIDLANLIPKSTDILYDGLHFTEYGAQEVARNIANNL